jgi:hypothetical protein
VLDPRIQSGLAPAAREALRQALAEGLHGAFVLGLILVIIGLAIVVRFMPAGRVTERVPALTAAHQSEGGGQAG